MRAGILRYLSSRPDESFDVESLMQTFGRLRLDVENCVRELVDFGVAQRSPGDAAAVSRRSGRRTSAAADLLDSFLERRAAVTHRGSVAVGAALPRDDRPRREDADRLRVDSHGRQVRHLGARCSDPTGSGKEVVARMIHELSRRSAAKFQAVNCAALPDTLFESEIFGYEKGAFTGAHDRKPGRLELANDGTLFLDEIGDMSLIAQAKLLRVLEERRFERLGGQKSISVDFRLISATNRPLEQFVRDGRFREDLYYRVNAFAIRLPSLRERQVDIPVLAQRFLARYCAAQGLPLDSKDFSREALDLLLGYHVARQHPRARKHGLARRAVGAGPDDPRAPTSSSCTRPRRRRSHRAIGCRRWPKPNARTSSACSRRCSGTRRKRRACSTSAAGRSIARSSSISSSPRHARERARRVTADAVCARHLSIQSGVAPVRPRPHQRHTRRAGYQTPARQSTTRRSG